MKMADYKMGREAEAVTGRAEQFARDSRPGAEELKKLICS